MIKPTEGLWEGRTWAIVQGLMCVFIVWATGTLWDMSRVVVRIEERLSHSTQYITIYRTEQAERDRRQDERIELLRKEVSALVGHLQEHSKK